MKNSNGITKENGYRYKVLPDICVCCGEYVPEGRMICWKCEHEYDAEDEMEFFRPKQEPAYTDSNEDRMNEKEKSKVRLFSAVKNRKRKLR